MLSIWRHDLFKISSLPVLMCLWVVIMSFCLLSLHDSNEILFLNFHPTWWDFILLKNGWLHLRIPGVTEFKSLFTAIFNPFIYASFDGAVLTLQINDDDSMHQNTRQWSFFVRKVFVVFWGTNERENVTKGIDKPRLHRQKRIRRKP